MGIIAAAVITVVVVIFLQSNRKASSVTLDQGNEIQDEMKTRTSSADSQLREFVIQMGTLPVEAIQNEDRLVEITDSQVLAHVNNLIPGLGQVLNAANNVAQAIQTNGEVLYRAIIPAGAKLAESKAMEGAVRGIYHGLNGIQGHANLVVAKGTSVMPNVAAAAMRVASMVVGQYYMAQINHQMSEMSEEISKISDFQNNEYRSRVYSLITLVKRNTDFQVEIIEWE